MTSTREAGLEKLILDWGARIGFAASSEKVKLNQLENLIASLDDVEGREALLVTAAFAQRQAERRGAKRPVVGKTTARLIIRAMLELYEKNAGKEEARKMLEFAKWIREALPRGVPEGLKPDQVTLQELLERLGR